MLDTKFLSPQLFSDQHNGKINSRGTVHHNRKGMPHTLGQKALQLKKGDTLCKVKGGINTVCWQDKRSLHPHQREPPPHHVILWIKKEMHQNLCALRVTNLCFVYVSDMMANSYSIPVQHGNGLRSSSSTY